MKRMKLEYGDAMMIYCFGCVNREDTIARFTHVIPHVANEGYPHPDVRPAGEDRRVHGRRGLGAVLPEAPAEHGRLSGPRQGKLPEGIRCNEGRTAAYGSAGKDEQRRGIRR